MAKPVAFGHVALHVQISNKYLVMGYNCDEVYLHTVPLFHVGGLVSGLAVLFQQARQIFMPKITPTGLVDAVQAFEVTTFTAVPTVLHDVLALTNAAAE